MNTVARLEYLRDRGYPFTLEYLQRRLGVLQRFAAQSDENARLARDEIQTVQNGLKAIGGELEGLRDASLIRRKQAAEQELRESINASRIRSIDASSSSRSAPLASPRCATDSSSKSPRWMRCTCAGST
jgi:hypothetical protein